MRMITPLAVWAVSRILDTPKVKGHLQRVDASAYKSLRRVGRNAARNRAWLAGGTAAIALGIGMLSKASRSK